jgi:hypothetical protein
MIEKKTKYMIAARNDRTIRDLGQSMVIGDKYFKVVKKFVCLGSLMTPTNEVKLEIQQRIQTAFSECANICDRAIFHARQNSPLTRP